MTPIRTLVTCIPFQSLALAGELGGTSRFDDSSSCGDVTVNSFAAEDDPPMSMIMRLFEGTSLIKQLKEVNNESPGWLTFSLSWNIWISVKFERSRFGQHDRFRC